MNTITAAYQKRKNKQELNEQKQDMKAGKIPSTVMDSRATSHCGKATDPLIYTGQVSPKIFHTPLAQTSQATQQN